MLPISPRPGFVDEFVLIDGVTRTGKFALAHVVSSFEGMEFFQYHVLLETLLYLNRLGKIDRDTSRALAQLDFDLNTFNMILGRSLNSREHDLSCISKAAVPEEFTARAQNENREALLASFKAAKRIPVQINHEGLANAKTLFYIFPKVKIVNIIRDPSALVESWYRRGWGKRIGHDPSSGWLTLDHAQGPIPWWAADWAAEYQQLSEVDRCIKSVATLISLAKSEWLSLPAADQKNVLFVNFETMVTDPQTTVSRLGNFLQRRPLAEQAGILERERMPRTLEDGHALKSRARLEKLASPQMNIILGGLVEDYREFWGPLACR